MNKRIFSPITILVLLIPFLLAACSGAPPLPSGTLPVNSTPSPDDIVMSAGGGMYRANIATGDPDRILVAVQDWSVGKEVVSVLYRPDIESRPGESHTDIIVVSSTRALTANDTLTLYAVGLPAGITLVDTYSSSVAVSGNLGTVVVVSVSAALAPGEYDFKIGIRINGKNYGDVPCKVIVAQ